MTTSTRTPSEFSKSGEGTAVDEVAGAAGAGHDVPSAEYLSRLANEMFAALPGTNAPGATPPSVPSGTPAPASLPHSLPTGTGLSAPGVGSPGAGLPLNAPAPTAVASPHGLPHSLPGGVGLSPPGVPAAPSLGGGAGVPSSPTGSSLPGIAAPGEVLPVKVSPHAPLNASSPAAAPTPSPSLAPAPLSSGSIRPPTQSLPVGATPTFPAAPGIAPTSPPGIPSASAQGLPPNKATSTGFIPPSHGAPSALGHPLAPPTPLPAAAPVAPPVVPSPEALGFAPKLPASAASPTPAVPVASPSFYFLQEAGPRPQPGAQPIQVGRFTPELAAAPAVTHHGFDVEAVRRDFPILQEKIGGKQLIWLDNAATTQKPQVVIDRLVSFYQHENSNIHRGAHELAARATDAYENARDQVASFVNASSSDEIVFTRGATEAINLVAQSWGRQNVGEGDEVLITWLEHHANIVPWQQLCSEKKAILRVTPVDDTGQIILDEYQRLLSERTRIVSFPLVSNALGTVTPARQMIELAHRYGARVLADGAQSVSHMRTDVQALDCDWFVFSGHKVFAPTGIGAMYGKRELLNATLPWQGGGNMIQDVTFEKTIYQPAPMRFEAGTGNIADAAGLGTALAYLERVGIENVARHEHELLAYATKGLLGVPGVRIIGTAPEKAGVISFVVAGHRSEDVGKALSGEGIAVRAGHHCAQPILRRFGVESTVRPSFALYNTCADIDALIAALLRLPAIQGPR